MGILRDVFRFCMLSQTVFMRAPTHSWASALQLTRFVGRGPAPNVPVLLRFKLLSKGRISWPTGLYGVLCLQKHPSVSHKGQAHI